jgi:hypothetical protein
MRHHPGLEKGPDELEHPLIRHPRGDPRHPEREMIGGLQSGAAFAMFSRSLRVPSSRRRSRATS